MNETIRRFRPGGWKDFDMVMFGMSVATIMWVLVTH